MFKKVLYLNILLLTLLSNEVRNIAACMVIDSDERTELIGEESSEKEGKEEAKDENEKLDRWFSGQFGGPSFHDGTFALNYNRFFKSDEKPEILLPPPEQHF